MAKEPFLCSYFARVPAGISSFGSSSENLPSSVETARIMPWLSKPFIIFGSKFATNIHFFPTKTEQSGKNREMPEIICLGFSSAKSTSNFKSLSVSGTFSALKIFPTTNSTFLKSSIYSHFCKFLLSKYLCNINAAAESSIFLLPSLFIFLSLFFSFPPSPRASTDVKNSFCL